MEELKFGAPLSAAPVRGELRYYMFSLPVTSDD